MENQPLAFRSLIEGEQKIRLRNKKDPVEPNKKPYSQLLRKKLRETIGGKFHVTVAFREHSNGVSRAYVECGHNVPMPVYYATEDLQSHHQLQFFAKSLQQLARRCSRSRSVPICPQDGIFHWIVH